MPVIVVGADTPEGEEILEALASPGREIRVYVSDETAGPGFRETGFKVAIGDISDESHIEAAATTCFSAVLVAPAAGDGRETAFANSPEQVLEGWARAVSAAGVRRVIWVGDESVPEVAVPETATVAARRSGLGRAVADLDDAQKI